MFDGNFLRVMVIFDDECFDVVYGVCVYVDNVEWCICEGERFFVSVDVVFVGSVFVVLNFCGCMVCFDVFFCVVFY